MLNRISWSLDSWKWVPGWGSSTILATHMMNHIVETWYDLRVAEPNGALEVTASQQVVGAIAMHLSLVYTVVRMYLWSPGYSHRNGLTSKGSILFCMTLRELPCAIFNTRSSAREIGLF